jgi:hypothetical protein
MGLRSYDNTEIGARPRGKIGRGTIDLMFAFLGIDSTRSTRGRVEHNSQGSFLRDFYTYHRQLR